jgi:hypothetical protein
MDFAHAVRSALLVILAAFNFAVLVPATFFAIYIAFGADTGWKEPPDLSLLTFVAHGRCGSAGLHRSVVLPDRAVGLLLHLASVAVVKSKNL